MNQPVQEFGDRDHWTKKIRDFLIDSEVQSECLDLKRDYLAKFPTVYLLSRFNLDELMREFLGDSVCGDEAPSCSVSASKAEVHVSELKLVIVERLNPIYEPKMKSVDRYFRIDLTSEFPRFSSSCMSGRSDEGYFFTGRTHASQKIIRDTRVPMSKIARVELRKKEQLLWNFGRPDEHWNDRPTTEQKQELAPKEIIELLNEN